MREYRAIISRLFRDDCGRSQQPLCLRETGGEMLMLPWSIFAQCRWRVTFLPSREVCTITVSVSICDTFLEALPAPKSVRCAFLVSVHGTIVIWQKAPLRKEIIWLTRTVDRTGPWRKVFRVGRWCKGIGDENPRTHFQRFIIPATCFRGPPAGSACCHLIRIDLECAHVPRQALARAQVRSQEARLKMECMLSPCFRGT